MDIALLVARVSLAAVFALAGVAKLADPAGSRKAVVDFGAPSVLAPAFGMALPITELAIAAALIPRPIAWWGGVGALTLLLLFIGAISYNLAHGRSPNCHCFGQLHSAPAGWPTLLRNGLLALVASFILWQGPRQHGADIVGWLGQLPAIWLLGLFLTLAFLLFATGTGWFGLQLLRQQGRLLLRLEALEAQLATAGGEPLAHPAASFTVGLPVGAPAPAFQLQGLNGETLTLEALRAGGKPLLLAFTDPGCGPCTVLLPDLARYQREYASQLTLALISRGTIEANRQKATGHGLRHLLLQQDREVATAYHAPATPSAVLVSVQGAIASAVAQGADQIRALVAQAVGLPALNHLPQVLPRNGDEHGGLVASPPAAVPQGQPAPTLALPDLNGKTVTLSDFRGRETLVLFWDPSCGFCQRMLDDLKAWEASPPADAPQLLVISTGSVEVNAAMGILSPVLLEPSFTTGYLWGARGTPSAVLVDAEGRVASSVAVGAPAVLALAHAGKEAV